MWQVPENRMFAYERMAIPNTEVSASALAPDDAGCTALAPALNVLILENLQV
jgi:hypothetical protein